MSRLCVALGIAVVLLVGVVIGQAMSSPRAQAQQGPRQWRECFTASTWFHDGAAMGSPGFGPRTVQVPPGWVPIGGTTGNTGASVVLCR